MMPNSETPNRTDTVKRRGLITAGTALAVGALAKIMAKPAAAGHPGSDPTICHLGVLNKATATTTVSTTPIPPTAPISTAFIGIDSETGVFGECTGSFGTGVFGSGRSGGSGVQGQSVNGEGVHGFSATNHGVSATSSTNFGLFASSASGQAADFAGNVLIRFGRLEVQGNQTVTGTLSVGLNAASGGQAQLQLAPGALAGAPSSGNHERGELWLDSNGDLYLCKASGMPGTWKLVA